MELEEGEILQQPHSQKQHNPPDERDLWALDLEELESIVENENELKERRLELARKYAEECSIKSKVEEDELHSLETEIENRCKELRVKEKQLASVEGELQLICRDVEIKEREYEETERCLKECKREVREKEEHLKLIKTSICEYDRRLRLKQEECSWQLEMLQMLTTERDEVERKMKIGFDERQKEIEDNVARLAVIQDLIKDREIELKTFDMQFQQSVVSSEKLLRENEKLLRAQVAKRDECSKEIKMKEEELGTMEKLIDTMGKKNESIKAMREKIIQLLQEVESNKKDNELMKERKLELEKKEEEFEEVMKKLELSQRANELLKERKLELEKKEEEFQEVVKNLELSRRAIEMLKERNLESQNREKRLVEEMKCIEASSKQCDRRLMEFEMTEKRFTEQLKEVELRKEECDVRMKSLCSKEKHFKVRFKELESNKKEFDKRTKELGLKEKELEEHTRELESKEKKHKEKVEELESKEKKHKEEIEELESKEKKHKEEFEELESKVKQFECTMKKFLSEQEHAKERAKEQESEKDKLEAQVREHELKEKEYEVRVQELSSKEKKFEIQVKQLELKVKEYEEQLKELASKEKQHDAQHSQAPQALDNESTPTTDGGNFHLVLNERTNEPELYVNTILVDLQSTLDPAKLVLDVIQKPILRLDQNEDKGAIIEERHIFLLEQLMRISPDIKYHVRKGAMKLALDLKANINMGANTENSLVVLGFLLLLSAYGLVSSFDEDEIFKHFELVAQHRQTVELFRTLGFVDKISDFVQILINKQRIIEAVKFICAYDLVAKFRPVHLLSQHRQKQRQHYKKFCKGMPNQQKVEATEKEIGVLKNVLECILDNNIGSANLVNDIRINIHKLERQKENLARSLAASKPISKDEEVQQQQHQQQQQRQQGQQQQGQQKPKPKPKRKKRSNETTNSYPPQDSNHIKRPRVATPPPPPPPPPPQPANLHPQFQHPHVFVPRGMAPPRPRGVMPGQFSYHPKQGYYRHHAGPQYFYHPGPYPPHI